MGWLLNAAGLVVLGIVGVDIFLTVLHHWRGSGPVATRLSRWIWRGARALAPRIPDGSRRGVLGLVGPLIIPVTLVTWAGMTILGFALLYLPWMPGRFSAGSVPAPATLGDALYFSGVSFFTLGYGDIVPVTRWMRVLGVVQAGAGFALVTLAISYFTAVYRSFSIQRTLAESLYAQTGHDGAAGLLVRYLGHGANEDEVVEVVNRLREGMAQVRSAYNDYPILLYFLPARPGDTLVRMIFVTLDLCFLLDTAVDRGGEGRLARLGERSGLEEVAGHLLDWLETNLVLGDPTRVEGETDAEARYAHTLRTLTEGGVAVSRDPEAARRYVRRWREPESRLRACAEAAGEEWSTVNGEA